MHSEFGGSVRKNSKSAGRNFSDHSRGTCCASYVAGILSLGGKSMKDPKNNACIKHTHKQMKLRAFESDK